MPGKRKTSSTANVSHLSKRREPAQSPASGSPRTTDLGTYWESKGSDDSTSEDEVDTQEKAQVALNELRNVLANSADKTVFTVGGKIDTTNNGQSPFPFTIRWNTGKVRSGRTVSLPVGKDKDLQRSFHQLVKECEPATFGRGNKDVLDEEYRKAGKMDPVNFSTNFTPYEYGVIDTVAQALAYNDDKSQTNYRGVRAQLYNLNASIFFYRLTKGHLGWGRIYSGPSGKFKPHVDTPRSEQQMGSLVVCLPSPHKGGQLAVRHQGREVIYDWGPESASTIQWAAFFSDCEHEVLEVTEGHRVTLTYNLYWTLYGPASMSEHLDALDQKSLLFYSALNKLMRCPDFLPDGGSVGFTCVHAYPHSANALHRHLPYSLKGVDMVVYQALKRFSEDVTVDAMLDETRYHDFRRDDDDEVSDGQAYIAGGDRRVRFCDEPEEEDRAPHPQEIYDPQEVTWIDYTPYGNSHKELAAAFIINGNQAALEVYYSSAVLIGEIGPYKDRRNAPQKLTQ